MNVSKNFCGGEFQFFFEMKEEYKVFCVKILMLFIDIIYLSLIIEIGVYLKYSTPNPLWKLLKM